MNPPDQFTMNLPAVQCHAYWQALTRYNIDLSWQDLYDITMLVESHNAVYLYKHYEEEYDKWSHIHAVMWKGNLLPICMADDPKKGRIVSTVLPPEVINNTQITQQCLQNLLEFYEKHKNSV